MNSAEYAAIAARESVKASIVKAAARLAWVNWWADQCSCGRADFETHRLDGTRDADPAKHRELGAVPGAELMGIAPPTPHDAITWAESLIYGIEFANGRAGKGGIAELFAEAAAVPLDRSWHRTAHPDDFGHAMAAEALGMGIGWEDDHPPHGMHIPHREYMGRDINPVPSPLTSGYASSRRTPKAPAEFVTGEPERYRWVGKWYHPATGAEFDAFRLQGSRRRRLVIPLIDARIPEPMYIFQPRRG